jgi:hypothetical protein
MASNVGKDAVSESLETRSSVADVVQQQATASPTQTLLRAVVVEVLYDLAAIPDEDIEELKSLVNVPDLVASAPRNSIIARVTTAGADKKAEVAREQVTEEEQQKADENKESIEEKDAIGKVGILAYPFFPPHLCMPLKPGEQVWLVTESPDTPSKIMYWMCRVTEPDHVDDINYTHSDRKFSGSLAPKTSKEKADAATGSSEKTDTSSSSSTGQAEGEKQTFDKNEDGIDDRIFGFPNGTGEADGYTLAEEFAYEEIVNLASAYNQFRTQDVPRYTKRPGDLVLQGSNNTLICLGEERGWRHDDSPADSETSNATETEDQLTEKNGHVWGAIDIVAGRGRYNWRMLGEEVETSTSSEPLSPSARVILNSPDADQGRTAWVEVNKNPQESDNAEENRKDNPTEGDPDFFSDAARIIISHGSKTDENFNIAEIGATLPTPIGESFGQYDLVNKEGEYPSAITTKADEIRVIARKLEAGSPVEGAPEINGSIRLIKEGAPDGDLATIMLLPDGTVQITGSRIVLGRHPDDGGLGADNKGPGEGNSQPYVKYQQLEDLLTAMMKDVQTFCDTVLTHTTPGYGAPSVQLNSAANALKAAMSSRIGEIPDLQSERIFGE